MSYRVLSIDGGGVRGVLVLAILQRLSNESQRSNWLNQIDLFAGTSTGGVIALGLAAGIAPAEGQRRYRQEAPAIFADSLWDNVKDLGFAVGAKYSNDALSASLTETFGNKTLAHLPRRVLIPTFDLDNEGQSADGVRRWKPKFFHNFPGEDSDGTQRVVDVAMRTSAAPTQFPMVQGYIDGGVVANNPSMAALAQAVDAKTGGQELTAVSLLSLGTGKTPQFLTETDADWGWQQWALRLKAAPKLSIDVPILGIILEGLDGVPTYQCERLLGDRHCRLQPQLPEPIALDAVDRIDDLIAFAQTLDLSSTIEWINTHFD